MTISGQAHKVFTSQILVFLHAARTNEKILNMTLSAGAISFRILKTGIVNTALFQQLQNFTNTALEQLVESEIKSRIQNYY
jgi:hypothetical protein